MKKGGGVEYLGEIVYLLYADGQRSFMYEKVTSMKLKLIALKSSLLTPIQFSFGNRYK